MNSCIHVTQSSRRLHARDDRDARTFFFFFPRDDVDARTRRDFFIETVLGGDGYILHWSVRDVCMYVIERMRARHGEIFPAFGSARMSAEIVVSVRIESHRIARPHSASRDT